MAIAVVFLLAMTDMSQAADEEIKADVPLLVEMEGLTIPVIRGGRVEKYVLVKVTLEMEDSKSKSLAERSFPRLKDAFYRALHDYFGFQCPGTKGINVRVVKARLMRAGAPSARKKSKRYLFKALSNALRRNSEFKAQIILVAE